MEINDKKFDKFLHHPNHTIQLLENLETKIRVAKVALNSISEDLIQAGLDIASYRQEILDAVKFEDQENEKVQ